MQKQILQEIKEIRTLLAQVVGSGDQPADERFSIENVDKAAKAFRKMQIERGEWVKEDDISRHIKNSGYRAGPFIRKEFGFTNFFKSGRTFFYNKAGLIALSNELKERNVELARYIEFKHDRAEFEKKIASLSPGKGKKKKGYVLPSDVKDITTSPAPMPPADVVREDIAMLRAEFIQRKLSEYVDVYHDNHAMMKYIYHFEKYLAPGTKAQIKKWCDQFNYANSLLSRLSAKKVPFVPVDESDMFEL